MAYKGNASRLFHVDRDGSVILHAEGDPGHVLKHGNGILLGGHVIPKGVITKAFVSIVGLYPFHGLRDVRVCADD